MAALNNFLNLLKKTWQMVYVLLEDFIENEDRNGLKES